MPVGVPRERLVGVAGGELDLWWRRLDLDVIPSARVEAVRDVVTGRDPLFQRTGPPPRRHAACCRSRASASCGRWVAAP